MRKRGSEAVEKIPAWIIALLVLLLVVGIILFFPINVWGFLPTFSLDDFVNPDDGSGMTKDEQLVIQGLVNSIIEMEVNPIDLPGGQVAENPPNVGYDNEGNSFKIVPAVAIEQCSLMDNTRLAEILNTKRTVDDVKNAATALEKSYSLSPDRCLRYSALIVSEANRIGVDPFLLLALMVQESQCNANAQSRSEPPSVGLMQIYPGSKYEVCKQESSLRDSASACVADLKVPAKNIPLGANTLKSKFRENPTQFSKACTSSYKKKYYQGWVAAIRGYNGWSCMKSFPEQDKFVDQVLEKYSIALTDFVERKAEEGKNLCAEATATGA